MPLRQECSPNWDKHSFDMQGMIQRQSAITLKLSTIKSGSSKRPLISRFPSNHVMRLGSVPRKHSRHQLQTCLQWPRALGIVPQLHFYQFPAHFSYPQGHVRHSSRFANRLGKRKLTIILKTILSDPSLPSDSNYVLSKTSDNYG